MAFSRLLSFPLLVSSYDAASLLQVRTADVDDREAHKEQMISDPSVCWKEFVGFASSQPWTHRLECNASEAEFGCTAKSQYKFRGVDDAGERCKALCNQKNNCSHAMLTTNKKQKCTLQYTPTDGLIIVPEQETQPRTTWVKCGTPFALLHERFGSMDPDYEEEDEDITGVFFGLIQIRLENSLYLALNGDKSVTADTLDDELRNAGTFMFIPESNDMWTIKHVTSGHRLGLVEAGRTPVPVVPGVENKGGVCSWGLRYHLAQSGLTPNKTLCDQYYDTRAHYGDAHNRACVYVPSTGLCFPQGMAFKRGPVDTDGASGTTTIGWRNKRFCEGNACKFFMEKHHDGSVSMKNAESNEYFATENMINFQIIKQTDKSKICGRNVVLINGTCQEITKEWCESSAFKARTECARMVATDGFILVE